MIMTMDGAPEAPPIRAQPSSESQARAIYRLFPTAGRPSLWALVIPANPDDACHVAQVTQSAAAISDAIGGGLIDDELCAVQAREHQTGSEPADEPHAIYQDADRDRLGLPDNPRAHALATRLNWPHMANSTSLRGTVLVTGIDHTGHDTHVPNAVLAAAASEGLLPAASITPVLDIAAVGSAD
jgi:hypothetical protein